MDEPSYNRYDVHSRRVYRRLASVDTTFYIRGADGTTLAVYDGSGDLMYWNVLGAGEIIGRAVREASSTDRQYYVKDHLGSIRGTINESGGADHQSDYYPFGLEMPSRVWTTDPPRERYTGHEIEELGSNTTWYYAGARMYDPVVARWMTVDPLAEKFPGWSPYNYVLGNAISNADPDGRDVRCKTKADCETAAAELNAAHDGETMISVEETQWEESAFRLFKPSTWGKKKTVSGYRLSTTDSNFDWSRDSYTSALYDVINSNAVVFDLQLVPGNTDLARGPMVLTAFDIQGRNFTRRGGGTVMVSNQGNRLNEPMGVVLMHELVGHGHPAGGSYAHDVNRFYQRRLGYELSGSRGYSHDGYRPEIGWKKTGLFASGN